MRESVSLCLGMALVLACGASASAQYTIGDSWDRSAQWLPGAMHGTTINNPSPDGMGNMVWSYEHAFGGGFSSSNPWFEQPSTPMTWDSSWWKTGWGVWSRGNNFSPPILAERLIHTLSAKSANTMPMVRWTNPAGDGTLISISGDLTIGWQGFNGVGYESTVEVVIAVVDSSSGTITPLYTNTVTKPSSAPVKEFLSLPILLSGIVLDDGDSILFTHRAQAASIPAGWVSMYDDVSLTFTTIPAPSVGALGAVLGLAAAARRRR